MLINFITPSHTKRFFKKETKSYYKLIHSHNYNIYVIKNTMKNHKKLVEEVKNLNKSVEIKLKNYIKPSNKNNFENNEKIPEIEFVLRAQAFKYKDKTYGADLDNIVNGNENDSFEVNKFSGITVDIFVDITHNPIKKLLINDLIIIRGIKF